MHTKPSLIAALLAAFALLACGGAEQKSSFAKRFGDSSAQVDNAWFPLHVGWTYSYFGRKEGQDAYDDVIVTDHTRVIDGVRTQEVKDTLRLGTRLAEQTTDWYAQDRAGNVWYFGEKTAEFGADGKVKSTEGSWETGRDGARAGLFMPAHPRVGQSGQQEHYPGHAEDRFRILSLDVPANAQAAAHQRAMLVREWTPLEPGVIDHKRYLKGLGLVREESVKGGDEMLELISYTRPDAITPA